MRQGNPNVFKTCPAVQLVKLGKKKEKSPDSPNYFQGSGEILFFWGELKKLEGVMPSAGVIEDNSFALFSKQEIYKQKYWLLTPASKASITSSNSFNSLLNYNPNFLAMSAGMAFLFTKMFSVLYAAKAFDAYQIPLYLPEAPHEFFTMKYSLPFWSLAIP